MKNCLSSFKNIVKDGRFPLPMMVAVIVKPKESAMRYHEWVEFRSGLKNISFLLTLTGPIGLPRHAPVAQKIADQRYFGKK